MRLEFLKSACLFFILSLHSPFLLYAASPVLFPNLDLVDLFTEETALGQAKTMAVFLQVRFGKQLSPKLWEVYGVLRTGGDSRTFLDPSDRVYNDNYAFFGLGVDYLGLFTGSRLTLQLGTTTDLNSKIHLGGRDGRLGLTTSRAWATANYPWLYGNITFETFYTQRYRNILTNLQFLNFIRLFQIRVFNHTELEIAPTFVAMGTVDSAGYDYNRIIELRYGIRAKITGSSTLMFGPYFVFGKRWQQPTRFPTYKDFRLILTMTADI